MGTMLAQSGTPAALEASLRSADPLKNCSVESALKYQDWASKLGLGFSSLVVHQNSTGEEFTIPKLQAMSISHQAPLEITGIEGQQRYNVQSEIMHVAGLDGLASYLAVYKLRNPESTEPEALAALLKLDLVARPMYHGLTQLKKSSGLF